MMTEKKPNRLILIAVLACPWLLVAGTCVLTSLSALMAEYPDFSSGVVSLVSTLPGLTMMIAAVAAGFFAGRFGSYRTWLVVSGIIIAITGALPCFVTNFYLILFIRALLGFALGNIMPVTNAMIFELYSGEDRPKILGWHSASQYLGAVFYTMAGGYLSTIGWRYAFLTYAFALLPTVIAGLYLPGIKREAGAEAPRPKTERIKRGFSARAVFYLLLSALAYMFIFPLSLNISVILVDSNLGDSVVSGMVLSSNTIAAGAAGLCFQSAYKRFKSMSIPISLFICAIGMCVTFFAYSIIPIFSGAVLCGFGISYFSMSVINTASGFIHNSNIVLFSGLLSAATSIGTFCTSWYIAVIEKAGYTSARASITGSCGFFTVLTVIALIVELRYGRTRRVCPNHQNQ